MARNKNKRQFHKAPDKKISVIKSIRLSQCMIVKNEEANIERALSWGRGHLFEQIVVDTGSTDKTVEIAERMGAKVYHFEWINDFGAAKNFAIEQASGDWIAFLDADEYFSKEDTLRLMEYLKGIESDPTLRQLKAAIRCPIANLDDSGKPTTVLQQDRIFRNTPELRYSGRIHEVLSLTGPCMLVEDLTIIHTGYAETVYTEAGKAERNISMIKEELKNSPDDPNFKCYLADTLRSAGGETNEREAQRLYLEALDSGIPMFLQLKQNALVYLISIYCNDEDKLKEGYDLSRDAYNEFPNNPDFCYFYSRKLFSEKNFEAAWKTLTECESLLMSDSVGMANVMLNNTLTLFLLMVITAEELGKIEEVIRCATLILKEDKYRSGVLAPYLNAFKRPGYETSDEDILDLLRKIYNFSSIKDKIEILKAAKEVKNMHLVGLILSEFSPDEMKWLLETPE